MIREEILYCVTRNNIFVNNLKYKDVNNSVLKFKSDIKLQTKDLIDVLTNRINRYSRFIY